MSNSVIAGEDASWAQTFVTVTPNDDGFLREIEENVVVSGTTDTPLHLDTWNIVLRRSLINTTKDWITPSELEESKRIETECQTYLQGVPKVELPLVYRNEATQTLYMGRDGMGIATPMQYFDDIITVLNEKSLPEQKTSHVTQTTITMEDIVSENDIVTLLNLDDEMLFMLYLIDDPKPSIDTTEKENAFIEASDILNFVVERTLWMSKSESLSKKEKKDANVQTSLMYNHKTKKVTIDYEVQTDLTCEPKYSNSMLLAEYNETKNYCRDQVNRCIKNGVYPRIEIDNIVEEIMTKYKRQINLSSEEKIENTVEEDASNVKNITNSAEINANDVTTPNVKINDRVFVKKCRCGITSEIDRITQPIRDALSTGNGKMRKAPRNLSTTSHSYNTLISTESTTSSSKNSQPSSSSARSLPSSDVEALVVLKSAFCRRAKPLKQEKERVIYM